MTEKIDQKTAEMEFERFAEAMDLDLDTEGMDENEARDTSTDIRRVTGCIRKGSIVIDQDGNLIFTPTKTEMDKPIVFSEPSGGALLAMDKKKKHAEIGKFYASLAALTKLNAVTFNKMALSDLKVCIAVYTLLMT